MPARIDTLDTLAAVRVYGPDAQSFLQGQISCDLRALDETTLAPGSFSTPKGRVLAVVWLWREADGFVMLTEASVADALVRRLRMYVLRSRVRIERDPELHCGALLDAPVAPRTVARDDGLVSIGWACGARRLLVGPGETVHRALARSADAQGSTEDWLRAEIRAGLPMVTERTSEHFVAQWLDLDRIGALSFDKGCYTGQEVIARLHWRGGIKRRLFTARCAAPASPGVQIRTADGQLAGEVVLSAPDADGHLLLATVALPAADGPLQLDVDGAPALSDLRRCRPD